MVLSSPASECPFCEGWRPVEDGTPTLTERQNTRTRERHASAHCVRVGVPSRHTSTKVFLTSISMEGPVLNMLFKSLPTNYGRFNVECSDMLRSKMAMEAKV